MPPTVLLVLPWSPDAIGGVCEVAINLYRRFAAIPRLRPRLLVDEYPQRSFQRDETRTVGEVDRFHVPALPDRGKGLRHLAAFALRLPAALVRLVAYLRRENIRAINIHYPSLGSAGLLLARSLADPSIPVVLSFHGSDLRAAGEAGPLGRWLWRLMMARCDAAVACSRALAGEIECRFPQIGKRLHVVHNGVDGPSCREARMGGILPPELQGRFIACVATFENKKGQDVLLDAFRTVARLFPDVGLALVGRTGPNLDALRARAADDAFGRRVFLFPDSSHPDTLAIMAAAELLVLPSRQEPFGIVILEAASLGVPVVASRVGGIPEIVEDLRSGALVPADDAPALAEAICDLLRRPELGRRYAACLRDEAEKHFTWQRAADGYVALFAPVSRARSSRGAGDARHNAR